MQSGAYQKRELLFSLRIRVTRKGANLDRSRPDNQPGQGPGVFPVLSRPRRSRTELCCGDAEERPWGQAEAAVMAPESVRSRSS